MMQFILVPYIAIPEIYAIVLNDKPPSVNMVLKMSLNLSLLFAILWNCWGEQKSFFDIHDLLYFRKFGRSQKSSRKVCAYVTNTGKTF